MERTAIIKGKAELWRARLFLTLVRAVMMRANIEIAMKVGGSNLQPSFILFIPFSLHACFSAVIFIRLFKVYTYIHITKKKMASDPVN